MPNTNIAPMPLWILFSLPAAAFSALTCLIAFGGTVGPVGFVAGIVGLLSVTASFVVVPAAIYALAANRELRSIPQFVGTALCSLPILGMIASYFLGGI